MKINSIRKKLLVSMLGLIFIMMIIIIVFEIETDTKLSQLGFERGIELMRKSINKEGKTVSDEIAKHAENAIVSNNFQILEDLVKVHENVEYGILVENSGIAHIHTANPKLVDTRLDSEIDKFVLQQTKFTTQESEHNGVPCLEFITPVSIGDVSWGFLRLGLSLADLNAEIHDSRLIVKEHLKNAILEMIGISLLCILVGSLLIKNIAKRITNPLQQLTEFSNQLAEGNFNAQVTKEALKANDETEELSRAFVGMVAKLGESRAKLEDYNKSLEQEIAERKLNEEKISNIARGVSAETGDAFFISLVQYLANALDMAFVFIGKLVYPENKRVRTIALYANGKVVDNIEYDLANAPCENVFKEEMRSYLNGVQGKFPLDYLLKELRVESYCGITLCDSGGKVLGIMAGMDTKPIINQKIVESLIRIFAVRAAAELERLKSEEALNESHGRLQSILDNSPAVIYLKDIHGRYILINHQYEILFHIDKEKITGKTDREIFPLKMAESFQYNDQQVIEKGNPIEFEEYAPHEDGIHTYISAKFPLYDSNKVIYGVCGISTDITERKKMENEQKNFSKKLVESQERERKRIASELHDSLAQSMMVIHNEAQRNIKKLSQKSKDLGSWNLISSAALKSVDEIRTITYNLRPSELDQFGLKEAVQSLVERISRTSGVEIHKKIDLKAKSISPDLEIQVYRIIQEGLNNVVKHSLASKAKVNIKSSNKYMHVEISDDGKGFESHPKHENGAVTEGFGLSGINERAKMFGGSLKIESAVGKGTSVKVTIPLKNDKK